MKAGFEPYPSKSLTPIVLALLVAEASDLWRKIRYVLDRFSIDGGWNGL